MPAGGRRTSYNPKMHADLVENYAAGLSGDLACRGVGVDYSTLCKWFKKADADPEKYADYVQLRHDIKEAQSQRAKAWLAELLEIGGAEKSWQSRAWALERCFPENFGKESGKIMELINTMNELAQKLKEQS